MKPYPISVQLYSVREQAAKDFPSVLRTMAEIGFAGVEFAGLHGMPPREVRGLLNSLGLKTSSIHGPMPTADNVREIADTAAALGYTRHVTGFGPDAFATPEKTLAAAAAAQKGAELLAPHGLTLGIHNHWWEFDKQFGGKYPHQVFMDAAPDVFCEIDTYWAKVGGADAAKVVKQCGTRAPLFHIKDGPGNREQAMTAVGQGVMNWPAVFAAMHPGTEWVIIELDRCDTDMVEAVRESYRYLTAAGLAQGRK